MNKINLKSIDINFFKENKQITIYSLMILLLICLLINKLNYVYSSPMQSYIKDDVLINGSRIGRAEVISDKLLDKGSCIPGTKIKPKDIVMHQTGCIDVDADKMYESLKNANEDPYAGTAYSKYRNASWTITVGYDKIIQNMPLNWEAYAQGTYEGNETGISIEICMYTDGAKQRQAYLNAIELFKILRKSQGGLELKKHEDYTDKECPQWLLEGKYGLDWDWFEQKCLE